MAKWSWWQEIKAWVGIILWPWLGAYGPKDRATRRERYGR